MGVNPHGMLIELLWVAIMLRNQAFDKDEVISLDFH